MGITPLKQYHALPKQTQLHRTMMKSLIFLTLSIALLSGQASADAKKVKEHGQKHRIRVVVKYWATNDEGGKSMAKLPDEKKLKVQFADAHTEVASIKTGIKHNLREHEYLLEVDVYTDKHDGMQDLTVSYPGCKSQTAEWNLKNEARRVFELMEEQLPTD